MHTEQENRYLPVVEVNELFEELGFIYVKTLFQGTLTECLKYPIAFQSKIAEWLGFPAIDDNICEGIVIRHIGEVHVPKDFGKIMGLFSKDALTDFLKEYGEDYLNLEKSEQKLLNKALNQLSTELVKKVYMNQAYISEDL